MPSRVGRIPSRADVASSMTIPNEPSGTHALDAFRRKLLNAKEPIIRLSGAILGPDPTTVFFFISNAR